MVSVEKFGDWNKVEKLLGDLGYKVTHAYHIAAHSQATAIQRNIIKSIENQSYGHAKLSPDYKKWKAKKGLDTRILIATGRYLKEIQLWKDGTSWCVGIKGSSTYPDGTKVADVGRWLEYGTSKMPSRPHWRIEYNKVRRRIIERMRTDIKSNIMKGV